MLEPQMDQNVENYSNLVLSFQIRETWNVLGPLE